ncbi:MAG: hypothetical protein PVI11_03670 [Candidatus Aminicenantes bacterium]
MMNQLGFQVGDITKKGDTYIINIDGYTSKTRAIRKRGRFKPFKLTVEAVEGQVVLDESVLKSQGFLINKALLPKMVKVKPAKKGTVKSLPTKKGMVKSVPIKKAIVKQPTLIQKVTYPDTDTCVYWDENHKITWSGFTDGKVKLMLFRGNLNQGTITESTANDGSYMWQVPHLASSINYKIVVYGVSNPDQHAESGDFEIAQQPPGAVVTSPSGGEVYYPNDTVELSWSGLPGEEVKVDLYFGPRGGTLIQSTTNDGSHLWKIPSVYIKFARTNYRFIIRSRSVPNQWATSGTFEIRNPPQNTEVTSPQGSVEYRHHDTIEIMWSGFTGSSVTVELYRGNISVSVIAETTPNDGSHSWLIPSMPSLIGASDYRILVYDLNKLEYAETADFSIKPLRF